MSSIRVRAFLDRVEEDRAVILVGEEGLEVVWPIDALPEGVREGSVLSFTVHVDEEAKEQTEQVVDSLIDRLRRGE